MARDISRGDIPTLILAVLATEPLHGYGIARRIEQQSAQALTLREGSMYPALRNLEQSGFIESTWEPQSSGPARKVYQLTSAGKQELQTRQAEWQAYVQAMQTFLPNEA